MRNCSDIPSVLTIAGSDSGGGAGIQADLRTFHAFKVYGCSVITAVTSQNPDEVRRVDVLPPESVTCQLESVLDVFPVRVAKTGMLANRPIVECVAKTIQKYALQLVIDPVMVSTSGARLLETDAISAMQQKLFPQASWLTPNIPEAELLCGKKINSQNDLAEAAEELHNRYRCNVILKSGHAVNKDRAADIVCVDKKLFVLSSPLAVIAEKTAHGTGCTLSSALAAALASGKDWQQAVREAKAFVFGSLCEKATLSSTLSQMYPPEKNHLDNVRLEEF